MDSRCAGLSSRRMLFEIVVYEDASAEHFAHRLVDVLGESRALVVERDHRAEQLQVGIRARADPIDRLEQVVGALEREVARLHRNQQVRRRDERVHRDEAERGRRVDDDELVAVLHGREPVLQPVVRVDLAHELRLRAWRARCARAPRRGPAPETSGSTSSSEAWPTKHVVHRLRQRPHVEERHRGVGLGIEIDEQHAPPAHRERRREVDGRRGLSDAALLVCDRDDDQKMRVPSADGNGRMAGCYWRAACRVKHKVARRSRTALHLVLAELLVRQALEPLLQRDRRPRCRRLGSSRLRAPWMTASSTKIRAPERSARAIASEGRASTRQRRRAASGGWSVA